MVGGIWLWRSWRQSEKDLCATRESLEESHLDREEWRQRASLFIDGFRQAVHEQFSDWRLTPAECEVAEYLLKGFSHKDTAKFTKRSERTVRQHSVAIYRKARLTGRAAVSYNKTLISTTPTNTNAFAWEDTLYPPAAPVKKRIVLRSIKRTRQPHAPQFPEQSASCTGGHSTDKSCGGS